MPTLASRDVKVPHCNAREARPTARGNQYLGIRVEIATARQFERGRERLRQSLTQSQATLGYAVMAAVIHLSRRAATWHLRIAYLASADPEIASAAAF